jgi:hypothetical protein
MSLFPKNKTTSIFLIGFFLLIFNFANLHASDWQSQLQSLDSLSKKQFLKTFDYNLYLENEALTKVDSLVAHRGFLNGHQVDGDEFLYLLCEKYMEKFPIDTQNTLLFAKQIKTGEGFYHYSETTPDKKLRKVFAIMCDIILQECSNGLEKGITTREVDKTKEEVKDFIEVLNKCNYKINITETDKEKVVRNLKSANWYYLWKRYNSRCLEDCLDGGDCNKMCWLADALLIGFFLTVIGLIFWIIKKKRA